MANFEDYAAKNHEGEWYNTKYPPQPEKYGTACHGYKSDAAEVLFSDFAILGYDVYFEYNENRYYLLNCHDHVARTDESFDNEYEIFPDPNTLIENLIIEGKKLIDIIDEIEYIEPM